MRKMGGPFTEADPAWMWTNVMLPELKGPLVIATLAKDTVTPSGSKTRVPCVQEEKD